MGGKKGYFPLVRNEIAAIHLDNFYDLDSTHQPLEIHRANH